MNFDIKTSTNMPEIDEKKNPLMTSSLNSNRDPVDFGLHLVAFVYSTIYILSDHISYAHKRG